MKAIRAFLVLGLFVFFGFGANAQNGINKVNKNQVQSKKTPSKSNSVYQVQEEELKAIPAPPAPVAAPTPPPTTYQKATTPSTGKSVNKSNELKVAPGSSSQNNAIKHTPQQTKSMERQKKENIQK